MYLLVHLAADLIGHVGAHLFSKILVEVANKGLHVVAIHGRRTAINAMGKLVDNMVRAELDHVDAEESEINWLSLPDQYKCVLFKPVLFLLYHKVSNLKFLINLNSKFKCISFVLPVDSSQRSYLCFCYCWQWIFSLQCHARIPGGSQ